MTDFDTIEEQADDGELFCDDCGGSLDSDEIRIRDDAILCPECSADDWG